MFAVTAILSCVIKIRGLFKSTKWRPSFENVKFEALSAGRGSGRWFNIIHLLDRTETNIIFIWSGKVILGEAKPSPNIILPDQINMILGKVLSNKCFIIPATLHAPGPSHALLIQTKRPFTRYQYAPVQVCVLRHLFSNVEFYCI